MSKLTDFMSKSKIDPRRLLAASKKAEGLKADDRAIKLAKKRTKKGSASDAQKELATTKGRGGKAVTKPLLAKAQAGETVSAAAKQRILRAVNHVLASKKKDAVTAKDLF